MGRLAIIEDDGGLATTTSDHPADCKPVKQNNAAASTASAANHHRKNKAEVSVTNLAIMKEMNCQLMTVLKLFSIG